MVWKPEADTTTQGVKKDANRDEPIKLHPTLMLDNGYILR